MQPQHHDASAKDKRAIYNAQTPTSEYMYSIATSSPAPRTQMMATVRGISPVIARGCTYCKGEDRFDNQSLCICGDLSGGFFQGSSDYSFGADELTSKRDCPGGKENGEATLPIIVIIPALIDVPACLSVTHIGAIELKTNNN